MNKTVKKVIGLVIAIILLATNCTFATETLENEVANYDDQIMLLSEEFEEGAMIPTEWRRDIQSDDSIINNNVFESGDEYVLEDKYVQGDMYVGTIDAKLKNVTITGNLFMFAENAELENVSVTGSVYMFALNLDAKDLNVSGTLYLLSEDAKIVTDEMSISDLYTYSEDLEVKAIISRDALISGKDIKIQDGTIIGRNLTYPEDQDIEIGENIIVGGETTTYKMDEETEDDSSAIVTVEENGAKNTISSILYSTVLMGIVLIFVVMFSDKIVKVSRIEPKETNLFKTMGIGFLVLLVAIVLIFVLLISFFGIPLSLIWILILILAVFISTPVAAVALASVFVKDNDITKQKLYFVSLLIVFVLSILDNLPLGIVGVVVSAAVLFLGLGTLYNVIVKKINKNKKKKVTVKDDVKNEEVTVITENTSDVLNAKEVISEVQDNDENDDELAEENIDVLNKLDEIDDEDDNK